MSQGGVLKMSSSSFLFFFRGERSPLQPHLQGNGLRMSLDCHSRFVAARSSEVFHSSCYQNGKRYAGKRAVVVGSNTSAHDIAEDLWESGAKAQHGIRRSGEWLDRGLAS